MATAASEDELVGVPLFEQVHAARRPVLRERREIRQRAEGTSLKHPSSKDHDCMILFLAC
jgi:hypothetical protein